MVDIPGLVHSANKMQSEEDVELIQGLVVEYMKNPRTIILAVVTAKNGMYTRTLKPINRHNQS